VAGVPVLVLVLVRVLFGTPLSQYRPIINDEVAYWHQALTFSHAGFNGGYYTVDEATNPSGLTPFGPHGPGFAVLYGSFGSIFGWHRHTAVVLNLIAIAGAAWVWVWLTAPSLPRLLLGGAMLLTFWHMVFWAPTGMQESLHHAGAIVLAACFARVLGRPAGRPTRVLGPSPGRPTIVLGWIAIGLLAFIRPSWIILLPLWAIAVTRDARRPIQVAAVGGSVLYGALILFAYSNTTAPYGNGFFFLRAATRSVPLTALTDNLRSNLHRIVRTDQYDPIELLQRWQYGAFLLATGAATVWALRRRRQLPGLIPHLPLTALAMAGALGGMLLVYEFSNFAEHRILSGFLLFGAMLCLVAPGRMGPWLVAGLVLSNVLSVSMAADAFESRWRDHFEWDAQELSELHQAIDGNVVYQPGSSRWCNTLLTSQYPPHLIAMPAGIGLSVLQKPEQMHLPPRSRYILLDDAIHTPLAGRLNLDPIATLPYGTLYVNRDAMCD
jgi:hypothetical protein